MLAASPSLIQLPRVGRIAVAPVIAAVASFALLLAGPQTLTSQAVTAVAASSASSHAASAGQSAQAKPESSVQQTQPAQVDGATVPPAHEAVQAPCPHSASMDIPLSSTIEAKVTGSLDSGHLKAGKEIWVNVLHGLVYPGCTLNEGAAIYGRVTASVAQKNPDSSELSLVFDRADCEGHAKKAMPLRLIGLVGPAEISERMHDEVPNGLKGSQRSAPTAVLATLDRDDRLNPGGAPQTVHVGVVLGLPKVKLDYEGGPGCSSRLTSTDRSVQLQPGSELILIVQSAP
jgi:hypothetical protein